MLLAVENLTKRFGGLRAVDDCSLVVAEGSLTGLIGPNGAGKTTLFGLVSGFLKADQGNILFDGVPIGRLAPFERFRLGLCRTFQISREFKTLTVLENLMVVGLDQAGEKPWNPFLARRRVRETETALRGRARELLALVGLAEQEAKPAWTLSVGQKRLLDLARAMMANARLLLLDEPGAGVAPPLKAELGRCIQRLVAEANVTVIVIEHDIDLVLRLCDPIIVMSEGRVLTEGPPDAIRHDPRVLEAYLGRAH